MSPEWQRGTMTASTAALYLSLKWRERQVQFDVARSDVKERNSTCATMSHHLRKHLAGEVLFSRESPHLHSKCTMHDALFGVGQTGKQALGIHGMRCPSYNNFDKMRASATRARVLLLRGRYFRVLESASSPVDGDCIHGPV